MLKNNNHNIIYKKFLDFVLPLYEPKENDLKDLFDSLERQTSKDFNLIVVIDDFDTEENREKYNYIKNLLNSYSFDSIYYFGGRHGTFITEIMSITSDVASDYVWIINQDDELCNNNAIDILKYYDKRNGNPDVICFGATKNYYSFSKKDTDYNICEIIDKPSSLMMMQGNDLYTIDEHNKFKYIKKTSYFNEINKNNVDRLIDNTLWNKIFKTEIFKKIINENVIIPNFYGYLINGNDYLINILITPFIKNVLFIPEVFYKFNYIGSERSYQKLVSLSIAYDKKYFDDELVEKAFKQEYSFLYVFQYLDQFIQYLMTNNNFGEDFIKKNYVIYNGDDTKNIFDKITEDKLTYTRMIKESYDTFTFLRDRIKKWLNQEPFIFLDNFMREDILEYIERQYSK